MAKPRQKNKRQPSPVSPLSTREIEADNKPQMSGIDMPFLILTLLLLGVGLVALFSASYADAYHNMAGNGSHFVEKQSIFAVAGIAALFLIARINYHHLHYFAIPGTIGIMAVLATRKLIPSIWATHGGATRWINLVVTEIQPSEFAKVVVIVLFASMITLYGPKKMKTLRYGIAPFLGILAVYAGLLYLQPHLSAIIIIMGIGFVMMFLGGCNFWWFVPILPVGAVGIAVYLKLKPYSMKRILAWWDPFTDPLVKGYQSVQSHLAIGSGGVWGLGLGQSRQKHLFLPEPANDFIFSVWCEEMGLVGAILIIIAFAALICRGYYIAANAGDKFGTLLAAGITTHIAIQALFNMAVVTGLVPVTGAALPFFSYGGTSLLVLLCEIGLLLSVSRRMPVQKQG